ncbi:MAG: FtsX-like permease family protein [Blautia sp.]
MNKLFYPKLAGMNIWKNRRIYVPYILTCICNVAMFYMMHYMFANPDLKKIRGGDMVKSILFLGIIIIGIFSLIFLCYSNSFLTKQRKKEFGLYNVLGMEKRHIRRTMRWEMFYVVLISFGAGFLLGILGSKLLFLLLLKLLKVPAVFGFRISGSSIVGTTVWFLMIFFITLLVNMRQIHLANPVELLRGGNTGEREPKAKFLLVLIGGICLGLGYYLAVTTTNPLSALGIFFVAVLLVMIGTYCLFTAGSIAILKLMKWNKGFYYKTRHFTSVSGMMYRMKQNAVGLANICILSTGVLMMISGTVSMYAGMDGCIDQRYPFEVSHNVRGALQTEAVEKIEEMAAQQIENAGLTMENRQYYQAVTFSTVRQNEEFLFLTPQNSDTVDVTNMSVVVLMTLEDYNRLTGENRVLESDEDILLYQTNAPREPETMTFGNQTFRVKERLEECPYGDELGIYVAEGYFLVVRDFSVLESVDQLQKEAYGEDASELATYLSYDISGTEQEKKACEKQIDSRMTSLLEKELPNGGASVVSSYKTMEYQDMYAMYGGFFFLGLFLGTLFLMGTTLIIYYKQVSEGYDDKERFEIMQKVGMSKKEVRQSIRSQVVMVFFLPLLMAGVHVAFAFPLMTRLLSILGMNNVPMFGFCTLMSAVAFALVYAVIYAVTAKTYYKIVNS